MEPQITARDTLNHLLAADPFLRETLVLNHEPHNPNNYDEAYAFGDDASENLSRARSLLDTYNRYAKKLRKHNLAATKIILKAFKEQAYAHKDRLIDPLPHYGAPTLTGEPLQLTSTLQVQAGSILQSSACFWIRPNDLAQARIVKFVVGQVEAVNLAEGYATVRTSDGELFTLQPLGHTDTALLGFDGQSLEVPILPIAGATLEEAEHKHAHDTRMQAFTDYLQAYIEKYTQPSVSSMYYSHARALYRPTFAHTPFSGNPEMLEEEYAHVESVCTDFYRAGGPLDQLIDTTGQKLDAALKAYRQQLQS